MAKPSAHDTRPLPTIRQMDYLMAFYRYESRGIGVSIRAVSDGLGVSVMSVHNMLARLEDLGFVESVFPGHGRRRGVRLTEYGRSLCERRPALDLPRESVWDLRCAVSHALGAIRAMPDSGAVLGHVERLSAYSGALVRFADLLGADVVCKG